MAVIENHVQVQRSPEEVSDDCSDLRNELEWNPDARSVERLTAGPIGVGTRFLATWKQSGRVEVEHTRYERPRAWSTVARGPLGIRFDARVTPAGPGARLDVRFEVRPRGLARLAFPLLLPVFRRAQRRDMERIAHALRPA